MDLQEIDVNFDWIDKQIRLYDENDKLIKESMKKIKIVFVFINSSQEVVKSHNRIHHFIDDKCIISSTEIFRYFKNDRVQSSIKYGFNQLFVYNIDLDNKLYSDIESVNTTNFLSSYSYIKDIVITPSLFIFHEINCIYIIYKDTIKNNNNKTVKRYKNLQS